MAYNKAKEEYRWNQWKAEEEKILREQGVDEETIQKLREYDWDDFNAERRFWEHQTSLLDCMELLLEEKETKESQPESVEALLDTEEYTEAYYQDSPSVCEDQHSARAEAPGGQFQRPDSPDAEADGTKGSEAGGEESRLADFRWSPPDTENGKGRREYLQGS